MAVDLCYYDDKEYSEGSVIEVEGEYLECVANNGGVQWGEVIPEEKVSNRPDDQAVIEDMRTVARKPGLCYHDGKKFSVGAKVKMPNGQIKQCQNQSGGGTKWGTPM